MGNILVFLEHREGLLTAPTKAALTCTEKLRAQNSGSDLIGVTLGADAKRAALEATTYGFTRVWYSEAEITLEYTAPLYAAAVVEIVQRESATTVVAAATATGKDFLPRSAALLDAGQASDVIDVNHDGSFKRPIYAGDLIADVEVTTAIKLISVRASAFLQSVALGTQREDVVHEWTPSYNGNGSSRVVQRELSSNVRPELAAARVVVSGGRALQSKENFDKLLFPLADVLGAAVGASRAAVDAGYAPNDWQVGQTGKIVAPDLYFAVGISGAIQHLAGMKDSKCIVVINKDGDAPIFEIADYGLVGDLYEILPQLTEALKKALQ